MKKLTFLIDGSSNLITLDESLVINNNMYIYVKKATIFWENNNIPNNSTYMVNNQTEFLYSGRWTIDMNKSELEANNGIIFLKGYCVLVRVEIIHKLKFFTGNS